MVLAAALGPRAVPLSVGPSLPRAPLWPRDSEQGATSSSDTLTQGIEWFKYVGEEN